MVRKRSEIEILADILRVAESGARKSHIVYKANLNFKIVEGYLNILRNSGPGGSHSINWSVLNIRWSASKLVINSSVFSN